MFMAFPTLWNISFTSLRTIIKVFTLIYHVRMTAVDDFNDPTFIPVRVNHLVVRFLPHNVDDTVHSNVISATLTEIKLSGPLGGKFSRMCLRRENQGVLDL